MGQERLNGLALLHSPNTFQVDIDDVIKRFFIKYPPRIVCPVTAFDELNVCDEDTDDKEKSSDTLSDNRCRSERSDVEEDIVLEIIICSNNTPILCFPTSCGRRQQHPRKQKKQFPRIFITRVFTNPS